MMVSFMDFFLLSYMFVMVLSMTIFMSKCSIFNFLLLVKIFFLFYDCYLLKNVMMVLLLVFSDFELLFKYFNYKLFIIFYLLLFIIWFFLIWVLMWIL